MVKSASPQLILIKPDERKRSYWTKVSSYTFVRLPVRSMSLKSQQIIAYGTTGSAGSAYSFGLPLIGPGLFYLLAFLSRGQDPTHSLCTTIGAPQPLTKGDFEAFAGLRRPIPKYNRRRQPHGG